MGRVSMNTPSIFHVIRLSPRDRRFILIGLSWICANYHLWRCKGRLPNGRPDRVWKRNFDQGVYDQRLLDRVLALHATITSLKAGGRLRLATSMEFAVCAMAVRVAVTRHHHGHQQLDIARIDTSSARLLRRLEAARKCAKRTEIRQSGAVGYRQSAGAWCNFATWLRVHLLDCRCKQKRRPPPLRSRRVLVTQFTQWARAELIDRKHKVPAERELRRLVRLNLRYIRRCRSRFSVRDLINDRITASAHFANCVILHDEKVERQRNHE
jgi:hypothetical protein